MNADQSKHHLPAKARNKEGRYANLFQVGHNESEFLIEFGQRDGGIHTRIYVSPQYARVLADLLLNSLSEHEYERKPPPATIQ